MIIAEALNQRKTQFTAAKEVMTQIAAEAVVEKKNPETAAQDIAALLAKFDTAISTATDLTVRLNLANNRETIVFEGYTLTLMGAIALRDELTLRHSLRVTLLQSLDERLGKRSGRYGLYGARRTKDDVKEVSLIDHDAFRKENDALAERRRLLDLEIQKVNWSAEL